MEIKTTMTTCPNGHHYDAARHASCPYCAGQGGGFTPTETPSARPAGVGSFTPTEPLPGQNYSPSFTSTAPPSPMRDVGGTPNPFSSETIIGGGQAQAGRTDPVVGWLVCTEGPVRGTDYRIHAGYNYIGRDSGDIHIHGDQQISRQNHAMIAYDGSDHTYFVGPAAGRNLIKVNGKTVLNAVEVHSYDVISIGTTKLIFIALCGENFSWEQKESDHE